MSNDSIETPVSDIMTTPVEMVTPETTVAEATRVLHDAGIGSLVVGEERIEGIVTESDVVRSVADECDPTQTTVGELMSEPVVSIRPTETVRTAGERMGNNGVKKLPVTKSGRPVGMVTTTDLAHYLPTRRVGMARQPEPEVTKGEYE